MNYSKKRQVERKKERKKERKEPNQKRKKGKKEREKGKKTLYEEHTKRRFSFSCMGMHSPSFVE